MGQIKKHLMHFKDAVDDAYTKRLMLIGMVSHPTIYGNSTVPSRPTRLDNGEIYEPLF